MKTFRILILLFALTLAFSSQVFASDECDDTQIVIVVTQENNEHRPKAPARIPIECYYDSAENCIVASEKYDCGIVSVVISNDNTGYTTYGILSYADEPLRIWLHGGGGYTLTFVTTTGQTYSGTLSL